MDSLHCLQRFITRAFRTTPTTALEVEASIPPINITLNCYTTHYATHTNRLDPSNLIMCQIPKQYRNNVLTSSTPPLPYFPPPPRNIVAPYLIRQHEAKAKKMTVTRLIHMAKAITLNTKCMQNPPGKDRNTTRTCMSKSIYMCQRTRRAHL